MDVVERKYHRNPMEAYEIVLAPEGSTQIIHDVGISKSIFLKAIAYDEEKKTTKECYYEIEYSWDNVHWYLYFRNATDSDYYGIEKIVTGHSARLWRLKAENNIHSDQTIIVDLIIEAFTLEE